MNKVNYNNFEINLKTLIYKTKNLYKRNQLQMKFNKSQIQRRC